MRLTSGSTMGSHLGDRFPDLSDSLSSAGQVKQSFTITLFAAFSLLAVASAMINPNVTPVELVRDAEQILSLRREGAAQTSFLKFKAVETLKGNQRNKVTLTFEKSEPRQVEAMLGLLKKDNGHCLLMIGGKGKKRRGFLHVRARWFELRILGDGLLELQKESSWLLGVWNGGTDMLTRCVKHILKSKGKTRIPVNAGIMWDPMERIGTVDGTPIAIRVLHLTGDGAPYLHIASPKGDRIFRGLRRGEEGAITDVTNKADLKLSKNTGHQKLSKKLFTMLSEKEVDGLGKPSRIVVSDFTGDNLSDAIVPFEKGGLFFEGNRANSYESPRSCAVSTTHGKAVSTVADFDGDGLIDVVLSGDDGTKIFHNQGNVKFVECLAESGEVSYKAARFASWCSAADINGDGHPDLMVTYHEQLPQFYFNRGFRSFGFAVRLFTSLQGAEMNAADGQQAGVFADMNSDGAPDAILVLNNGEVWCLFNEGN